MEKLSLWDLDYARELNRILDSKPERNIRTGKYVRAVDGLILKVHAGMTPMIGLRDINPLWSCAEAVWFLSGKSDAAFMASFGFRVWDKFADAQGVVWSATGLRWRQNLGWPDQLKNVVAKLSQDRSNRQAVLLAWDPRLDAEKPGPNAPCVMIWHFHVVDGHLHCSVMQRSADMYFGLPHDVLGSHIVHLLLASKLGLNAGTMTYLVSNAHLYEDQWASAEEMVGRAAGFKDHAGPHFLDVSTIEVAPTDFVRAEQGDISLAYELEAKLRTGYEPFPPIVGPKLVI